MRRATLIAAMFLLGAASAAADARFDLVYGGRATTLEGAPLSGARDVVVRFFDAESGGARLLAGDRAVSDVSFDAAGVFSLTLPLTASERDAVLGAGSDVWIELELEDAAAPMPRQRWSAVPFAARVPVDGATVTFNASGELTVVPSGPTSASNVTYASVRANTGMELADDDASAVVTLKAKDSTSASYTLTLPPDDGASGQILATDGAGVLSWTSPATTLPPSGAASGDLSGTYPAPTIGTGKVTATHVLDGTLGNDDLHASAAIARTKVASGTASHVVINDGSGVLSSEAQLATSRGGTGVSGTATFPTSGVVVTRDATETLTNKTLTAPDVNGGSADSLTSLSVRDASAARDVRLAASSTTALTADRTLTLDVDDASRTLSLKRNLTVDGGNVVVTGQGGGSAVTLPASGTVATLAGAETLTNKTYVGNASIVNAGATVDFASGNIQHSTASCGAFALHNLKDGGSYLFIVKGAVSATCSFTAFSDAGTTPLTVHLPPGHGASIASKHTLYSAAVSGGDVYLSWIPGY